jgi:hypothetical protein
MAGIDVRGWSIALGLVAAMTSSSAAAQQQITLPPTDLAVPPVIGSRVPTESDKPLVLTPPLALRPDNQTGCVPVLPCGARLLGAVQKNGAVAVEFPALKW